MKPISSLCVDGLLLYRPHAWSLLAACALGAASGCDSGEIHSRWRSETGGGSSGESGESNAGYGPTAGAGPGSTTSGGGTSNGRGGRGGTAAHGSVDGGAAGEPGGGGDVSGAGNESDGGAAGAMAGVGGGPEEVALLLVPGLSERKRLRTPSGLDLVLEEKIQGFAATTPPETRIRRLTRALETDREWTAPAHEYIADFCRHPSGELTVVLVSDTRVVSLTRLTADLDPRGTAELHDPAVATDPHAEETGVTDLFASGLALDPAHVSPVGESSFVVVVSGINAVIGYRASFTEGAWTAPDRTLIEPPVALQPFLPTGGSFDTFGAIGAWFRAFIDAGDDGGLYVAVWAHPVRIRAHASVFQDGLVPLPPDPNLPGASDSDILLTKLDSRGTRVWSRVIGTEHEDEPYAIRVHGDSVAVVGRSRRFPGFDNTAWDAMVSENATTGDESRTITIALDASSILLGIEARSDGGWLLAGSDGWFQNPEGLSISYGKKLLLELPDLTAAPLRRSVADGPRQNELHSLLATPTGIAFAGHEDGPNTHTGDADASLIHATGVLGFLANH